MVVVGLMLVLPSTARVPLVPGMDTEVALVVVQRSVVDWPSVIVAASAVKLSIRGLTLTVTASVAAVQPLTPPAVRVYLVVVAGLTLLLPEATGVTDPTP